MATRKWRLRRADETGVVAIMVALSLVALLVVAALVANRGLAREHKVANKSYTDASAAAGIRNLDPGDGLSRPWVGVCAAVAYLRVNDPQLAAMSSSWHTGAGVIVGIDPCAAGSLLLSAICTNNSPSTWGWYTGTAGDLTVDVKSGYATPDPAFDASGSGDNSATGGCDQLAVIIHQTEAPGLGKVAAGSGNIVTAVRSVARMTAASGGNASAALLILERTDCPAISVNSNNTFIEVKGFGAAPGVIHSDSNGTGPACLPTLPAIYGKFAGPPGISARQSETGNPLLPGLITTVAGSGAAGAVPANASDGSSKVCAENATPAAPSSSPPTSCGAAGGRALSGRGVVDRRYNSANNVGVQGAMATAFGQFSLTATQAALAANGYTVLPGGCNQLAGSSALVKVYVDCPGGITFKNFTFTNATQIVFNGDVKLSSGNTLSMPNVTRLYIKGSTATNGGLQLMGTFNFNLGGSSTCAGRTSAANAQIVVGTGSFAGGAQSTFHLCQTTVLMYNQLTWASCPVPNAPVSGVGSAPYDNAACNGYVDVNAGGAMDWSAPNKFGALAGPADWANTLEDLALWTEASHTSSIGGGASMTITGVFFLPNANPFTISGHGNQTIAANAQFVARKLQVQGQGTLYMRPNPSDSFTLPLISDSYNLVR
jgi:hypothetical protein